MRWMNVGLRRHMLKLPSAVGTRRVASVVRQTEEVMAELSDDHRRLHRLLVTELPRAGAPLLPEAVAERLDLPPSTVSEMFDDLGARKALIARDDQGAVTWAYPITVEHTRHRITFRSGERLYAA